MSKKARKQEQQRIWKEQETARRHALYNPPLEGPELAAFIAARDAGFAAYDAVAKQSSIACGNPWNRNLLSRIGGTFLMPADAPWPQVDGRPLSAAVQIELSELPYSPPTLDGLARLLVFLEGPVQDGRLAYQGGALEVRGIAQGRHCVERSEGPVLESTPLAWERVLTVPGYPDDIDEIDDEVREAFDRLPNSAALFVDRFRRPSGVQVGGWPSWIQNGDSIGTFVVQIPEGGALELGPDGNLYIGREDDSWIHHWEIG